MARFDYATPGELFCSRSVSRKSRVTYRRFDTAAAAIQFAIESLGEDNLRAATLEVSEKRLSGDEIKVLYDHPDYPLARKAVAAAA